MERVDSNGWSVDGRPLDAGTQVLTELLGRRRGAVIAAVLLREGASADAVQAEGVVEGVVLPQAGPLESLYAAGEREGGGDLPQALGRFVVDAVKSDGQGKAGIVAADTQEIGGEDGLRGRSSAPRPLKAARNQSGNVPGGRSTPFS
ncbi:MAG TPA: hypothetical protein VKU02_02665 [Gemmataceae bacterium]|nr:hypothetical protein [Gemmataceae bacterium]